MTMATCISGALSDYPQSSLAANVLLNTGIWSSPDDFSHTYVFWILRRPNLLSLYSRYTLLRTSEIPRFLGIRVEEMVPMYGLIKLARPLSSYPLPLTQLASREELTHWLTRVLLNTISPPQPGPESYRVMYPSNLVSFVNLLLHVHAVGFPGHWLSEFLGDILADKLASTAVIHSKLPIPAAERTRTVVNRKLFLDPWKVDFETIFSIARGALPFPVSLRSPESVDDIRIATGAHEIGRYEVKAGQSIWCFPTSMNMRMNSDMCIVLVFMRPGLRFSADQLAARMGDVVEGRLTKPGEMYVLSLFDECCMRSGKIGWRMRRDRVSKMKKEKWVMVPIRFDAREAGK